MPIFDRPELKVQKDRRVCRITDTRIAKYSRRGILFSLCALAIAAAIGDMRIRAPQLLAALAIGFVILTLLRGYFVFRFNYLYSAGPNRWRAHYFIVSTLEAAWWGGILLCHVRLLGFAPETHFLWLYTVIFCSSVSSVFSPYHRFLTWYISLSLVPAAIVASVSGELIGSIYGALTVAFVWLTAHQAQRGSENYWDRLAAMQELQQRASYLAAERKRSEAVAIGLTNEFIANIGQEFRSQLSDSLGALALLEGEPLSERQREWVKLAKTASSQQLKLVDNVGFFARVARKDIHLRQASFNLVRTIEKSFKIAARVAHRQRLEFNFQIDDNLPVMVIGDSRKTAQLIRNLVDSAMLVAQVGELWGQVAFSPISNAEGQVTISLSDDGRGDTLPDESELFSSFAGLNTSQLTTGLGLSIAKALAEAMGGHLQLYATPEGNRYQVVIKFTMELNQRVYLTPDRRLQDCEVLLLHQKGLFIAGLTQMMRSFGMDVGTVRWAPDNVEMVDEALRLARERRQLIILAPAMDDSRLFDAFRELWQKSEPKADQCQLICLGSHGHKPHFTQLLHDFPGAQYLERPVTRRELHDALIKRLFGATKKASRRIVSGSGQPRQHSLLLIEESRRHQAVTEEMLQALGYRVAAVSSVEEALERLSEANYDLVLVDCQQNTEHSAQIIERLRHWEAEHKPGDRLPIIALTSITEEQFEGRCLAAGMDDFLTKPLSKELLREILERWLGNS